MQELLTELEAALQSQSPPLTAAFDAPATEDAIREAERAVNAAFPNDLRAFLLCANGQKSDGFSPIGDYIVPRMQFAPNVEDRSAWGYFLGLEQIVAHTLFHYELDEYEEDDEMRLFFGPVAHHHRHLMITGADDPVSIVLDLQPAEGGQVGQVLTINDQPDYTAFLASDLSSFLRRLIDGYQSGRFRREEDGTMTELDGR